MAETVTVQVTVGENVYEYEFDNIPSEDDIDAAMDTIGGRNKRRE